MKEHNCTIESVDVGGTSVLSRPRYVPEIIPPEGYLFDDGLTSLICSGWRDAWVRIKSCQLEKEAI